MWPNSPLNAAHLSYRTFSRPSSTRKVSLKFSPSGCLANLMSQLDRSRPLNIWIQSDFGALAMLARGPLAMIWPELVSPPPIPPPVPPAQAAAAARVNEASRRIDRESRRLDDMATLMRGVC